MGGVMDSNRAAVLEYEKFNADFCERLLLRLQGDVF